MAGVGNGRACQVLLDVQLLDREGDGPFTFLWDPGLREGRSRVSESPSNSTNGILASCAPMVVMMLIPFDSTNLGVFGSRLQDVLELFEVLEGSVRRFQPADEVLLDRGERLDGNGDIHRFRMRQR